MGIEISVVSTLWQRMTALPCFDAASESNSNGLLKSGCCKFGRFATSFFNSEKAFCWSDPHTNGWPAFFKRWIGSVLTAYARMNLWYTPRNPRRDSSPFMSPGGGISRMGFIFSGLADTPFLLITKPKKLTWLLKKKHFVNFIDRFAVSRRWKTWRMSSTCCFLSGENTMMSSM